MKSQQWKKKLINVVVKLPFIARFPFVKPLVAWMKWIHKIMGECDILKKHNGIKGGSWGLAGDRPGIGWGSLGDWPGDWRGGGDGRFLREVSCRIPSLVSSTVKFYCPILLMVHWQQIFLTLTDRVIKVWITHQAYQETPPHLSPLVQASHRTCHPRETSSPFRGGTGRTEQ